MLVLYLSCIGKTLVVYWYCFGTGIGIVMVLHLSCIGIAIGRGIVMVLNWYCGGIVLVLYCNRNGFGLGLNWSCFGIVISFAGLALVLYWCEYWYCIGIVLVLNWD